MSIERALQVIVADPLLHPKWLNSLSYLEYRGFRKIARSQTTGDMNADLLLHAMEEVRHAIFFKRLATKCGGPAFSSYKDDVLLSPIAVKGYFYHLDSGTVKLLRDRSQVELTKAAYCFITWLIEERAIEIYQVYSGLLKNGPFDFNLDGILRDEDRHLREMVEISDSLLERHGLSKAHFKDLEKRCFQSMWQEIERETRSSMPTRSQEYAL